MQLKWNFIYGWLHHWTHVKKNELCSRNSRNESATLQKPQQIEMIYANWHRIIHELFVLCDREMILYPFPLSDFSTVQILILQFIYEIATRNVNKMQKILISCFNKDEQSNIFFFWQNVLQWWSCGYYSCWTVFKNNIIKMVMVNSGIISFT